MKHPQAGQVIKVTDGPYKDKYIKVIDFFQNQFQGKSMEKLAKSQADLLSPVKRRGFPLDEKVVLGQVYPAMTFVCVHDTELHFQEIKKEDLPPNVVPIRPGPVLEEVHVMGADLNIADAIKEIEKAPKSKSEVRRLAVQKKEKKDDT